MYILVSGQVPKYYESDYRKHYCSLYVTLYVQVKYICSMLDVRGQLIRPQGAQESKNVKDLIETKMMQTTWKNIVPSPNYDF